jgi:hypothetical protein
MVECDALTAQQDVSRWKEGRGVDGIKIARLGEARAIFIRRLPA